MIDRTAMSVMTPNAIMRIESEDIRDHFAIRYLRARNRESFSFIDGYLMSLR